MTARLGQQPVQEKQEGSSCESSKEEESVQQSGMVLDKCKEEPGNITIKREPTDEEPEVFYTF